MSDGTGIKKTQDSFTPFVNALLTRSKNARAGFARIYPIYQKFQLDRFETQNASEGAVWAPLKSKKYAEDKKRMYGGGARRKSAKREAGNWKSYPGGGSKLLIATSTLAGAIIGPGSKNQLEGTDKHSAIFTDSSMRISVIMGGFNADNKKFEYAGFVAKERPFMEFSNLHIQEMKEELKKFLFKG